MKPYVSPEKIPSISPILKKINQDLLYNKIMNSDNSSDSPLNFSLL